MFAENLRSALTLPQFLQYSYLITECSKKIIFNTLEYNYCGTRLLNVAKETIINVIKMSKLLHLRYLSLQQA